MKLTNDIAKKNGNFSYQYKRADTNDKSSLLSFFTHNHNYPVVVGVYDDEVAGSVYLQKYAIK